MQDLLSTLKSLLLSDNWGSLWIPFLITGLTCPLLIRWAPKLKLFDNPGDSARKIHHQVKPLGGAALLLGLVPVIILYGSVPLVLSFAVLIVFFTGLIDDIFGLSPHVKLILQIIAATTVVVFSPFPTTRLSLAGDLNYGLTGIPNMVFISFWLVSGTNALNLVDGLDGLAAGIGLLALLPILPIAFSHQTFLLTAGLAAALLAIMFYNFYPARLFLGDGGSYLVGFLTSYLVITGLASAPASSGTWNPLIGILLLGIPVIDTALAIYRRAGSGKGVMQADQNHLHHKLYRRFGHVKAVLIIYALQIALSGIALALLCIRVPN